MSIFVLVVILVVLAVIFFIMCGTDAPGELVSITFVLFAGLFLWLIVANHFSWKVIGKHDIHITRDKTTGIQTISFPKQLGGYKVVNLNTLFGMSLSDSMFVRVIRYSGGPYAGIYYLETYEYDLMLKGTENVINVKYGSNEKNNDT